MSDRSPDNNANQPDTGLDNTAITRLLEIGVNEPRRPIDALIDRLLRRDGAEWFQSAIDFDGLGPDAEGILRNDNKDLESLVRLKSRGKSVLAAATNDTERLVGLVGYFMATAIAIRDHGVVIASRPRDDLATVLLDLAGAVPEPWASAVADAAERAADPNDVLRG